MPKEKRSWSITFRESAVLLGPYTFEAKNLHSAVRKARKEAWKRVTDPGLCTM